MMKPTIHLNGTSREELASQFSEAAAAIREAITANAAAAPNARDYYPQVPQVLIQAQKEYAARDRKLAGILHEFEELQRHVADSG